MKKLTLFFLLALVTISSSAFAEDYSHGKTIVSGIQKYYSAHNSYCSSYLIISNITEDTVQCKIRLYANDGLDIGDQLEVYSGDHLTNSAPLIASNTNTFSIPPNGTRVVSFYKATPQNVHGYAVIEWKSLNPKINKALVAIHKTQSRTSSSTLAEAGYLVNGGFPF